MQPNKNLQCYLDAKVYSGEEVRKSIEETKKEFPNKKVKVSIALNEFDMYIITFQFENKNKFFHTIMIKIWRKFKKIRLLENGKKEKLERYPNNQKNYGQYKQTKTYRPY